MTVQKTVISFVTTTKNKTTIRKIARKNNMTMSKYLEKLLETKLQSK